MIIGISGRARTGKSTIAAAFKSCFKKNGIKAEIYSFADELKRDLDEFTQKKLGISAFTEIDSEKIIIRPLLQCWGTNIWRAKDPDYWIKKVATQIKKLEKPHISIISDVRFASNELPWIQKQGGEIIYLSRFKDDGTEFPPAGKDEEENDEPLKKNANFRFSWESCSDNREILYYKGEQLMNNLFEYKFPEWKTIYPL